MGKDEDPSGEIYCVNQNYNRVSSQCEHLGNQWVAFKITDYNFKAQMFPLPKICSLVYDPAQQLSPQ